MDIKQEQESFYNFCRSYVENEESLIPSHFFEYFEVKQMIDVKSELDRHLNNLMISDELNINNQYKYLAKITKKRKKIWVAKNLEALASYLSGNQEDFRNFELVTTYKIFETAANELNDIEGRQGIFAGFERKKNSLEEWLDTEIPFIFDYPFMDKVKIDKANLKSLMRDIEVLSIVCFQAYKKQKNESESNGWIISETIQDKFWLGKDNSKLKYVNDKEFIEFVVENMGFDKETAELMLVTEEHLSRNGEMRRLGMDIKTANHLEMITSERPKVLGKAIDESFFFSKEVMDVLNLDDAKIYLALINMSLDNILKRMPVTLSLTEIHAMYYKSEIYDKKPVDKRRFKNREMISLVKRIIKLGNISYWIRTNEQARAIEKFGFFKHISFSNQNDDIIFKLEFPEKIADDFYSNQVIRLYSEHLGELSSLAWSLATNMQKDRINRSMSKNDEYILSYKDVLMFYYFGGNKGRKKRNITEIIAALEELKNVNLIVSDYELIGDEFKITFTNITEEEEKFLQKDVKLIE